MVKIKLRVSVSEDKARDALRLYTDDGKAIGRGHHVLTIPETGGGLFGEDEMTAFTIEITDPIELAKCIRRQM